MPFDLPVIPIMPLTCLIPFVLWLAFYPKVNECGTKSYAGKTTSWMKNETPKRRINSHILLYFSYFFFDPVCCTFQTTKKTKETKREKKRKRKKRGGERLICLDRLHFLCITMIANVSTITFFYTFFFFLLFWCSSSSFATQNFESWIIKWWSWENS